ncbi:hypothetical protein SRHO_G00302680 [Serrasalmus rhombeus]
MKASKSREVHSTEFGFNGSMAMISYIRKKGKAVLLLSTMHHSKMVDENSQKKKTETILFYNQTKGGVDTNDQMVGNYTCKRQTQRWPMVLWYNMIDIATLNAYSFFRAQHPEFSTGITDARRHFLTELSKDLVTLHMKSRLEGERHRGQTEEKEVPDVSKKQRPQSHQLLLEMQYPSTPK